mmetsp:Transcript_72021/g.204420  ORF Transcript_72021/g.204420 Transcript_72021/m.204420 type:complete len:498 (-) Transcript_72021:16-1509(-)
MPIRLCHARSMTAPWRTTDRATSVSEPVGPSRSCTLVPGFLQKPLLGEQSDVEDSFAAASDHFSTWAPVPSKSNAKVHSLQKCSTSWHQNVFLSRMHVHAANFAGRALRGSRLDEEEIASCVQKGILRLFGDDAGVNVRGANRQVPLDVNGRACTLEECQASLFRDIRHVFGVDDRCFSEALGRRSQESTDMRLVGQSAASGKSHSWFLLSAEMGYFLKTCSGTEAALLCKLLPSYLKHVQACMASGAGTLLPRFYGLYRVQRGREETLLLVMNNIFAGTFRIERRFDLKGSTRLRFASAKERSKGARATLKDRDLLRRGRPLVLASGAGEREELLRTVAADCRWLRGEGLIDYSLLVGVAEGEPGSGGPVGEHAAVLPLVPSGEADQNLAYLGIIDILTRYSWRKVIEHHLLSCLIGDVSCQPPSAYATRFSDFAAYIFRCTDSRRNLAAEDFERAWLGRGSLRRARVVAVLAAMVALLALTLTLVALARLLAAKV